MQIIFKFQPIKIVHRHKIAQESVYQLKKYYDEN